ncbi:UNVERIFIED_CONTAM: hypothetical protein GTU68_000389 [Idotea baltica]|nr:hypothetical protein [Idotea baltica]
MSVSKKVI